MEHQTAILQHISWQPFISRVFIYQCRRALFQIIKANKRRLKTEGFQNCYYYSIIPAFRRSVAYRIPILDYIHDWKYFVRLLIEPHVSESRSMEFTKQRDAKK